MSAPRFLVGVTLVDVEAATALQAERLVLEAIGAGQRRYGRRGWHVLSTSAEPQPVEFESERGEVV